MKAFAGLTRAAAAQRVTGAKGQVLDVLGAAGEAARVLLVGAGKKAAFDAVGAEHTAASAYHAVKTSGLTNLRVVPPEGGSAAHAALGV